MRKLITVMLGLGLAGSAMAATFTDVNVTRYHGKTSLKELTEALDANFTMLEGGTINLKLLAPLTLVTTNGAETNIIFHVLGEGGITASEGKDARVRIFADDGDDAPDKWEIIAKAANGDLIISNAQFGAAVLTLADTDAGATFAGAVIVTGGLTDNGNTTLGNAGTDRLDVKGTALFEEDVTNAAAVTCQAAFSTEGVTTLGNAGTDMTDVKGVTLFEEDVTNAAAVVMQSTLAVGGNFSTEATTTLGNGGTDFTDVKGVALFEEDVTNAAAVVMQSTLAVGGILTADTNITCTGKSMTLGGEEIITAANTTKYMVFQGTATNGETVTTGVTFGATPQVYLQWDNNAAEAIMIYQTNATLLARSVSTTQFTVGSMVEVTHATGVVYTVIGTRPD